MTVALSGEDLGEAIRRAFPSAVDAVAPDAVFVAPQTVRDVCLWLRDEQGFDYLLSVTAVDYLDYFDVVYHLLSLERNQSTIIKTRLQGRTSLRVPSVTPVWKTADFQERETWDLMGIQFEGHPNLKRIMMWEGFPGHPLRKDFLEFDHRTFAMQAGAGQGSQA